MPDPDAATPVSITADRIFYAFPFLANEMPVEDYVKERTYDLEVQAQEKAHRKALHERITRLRALVESGVPYGDAQASLEHPVRAPLDPPDAWLPDAVECAIWSYEECWSSFVFDIPSKCASLPDPWGHKREGLAMLAAFDHAAKDYDGSRKQAKTVPASSRRKATNQGKRKVRDNDVQSARKKTNTAAAKP